MPNRFTTCLLVSTSPFNSTTSGYDVPFFLSSKFYTSSDLLSGYPNSRFLEYDTYSSHLQHKIYVTSGFLPIQPLRRLLFPLCYCRFLRLIV
ncbi:hypothetical protein LXL04_001959 [Taraxacum kok-saghyz]